MDTNTSCHIIVVESVVTDVILVSSVDDNFDLFDAGLVTFIQAGPGEEWRLVTLDTEAERDAWKPESGWEVERLEFNYSKFTIKL